MLQFKVHGVDAETGKKVQPLDIAAPDLREAATLAKIRGVLPTRITPVTELLTVVKEPEPGTDEPQTKRTTLISIEGRPLWFAATLVVAVILAVLWFAGPAIRSADQQSGDSQISTGTATGLGWSLRDVEDQWSSNNGWYWSQKERAAAGTGIEYVGSNVIYPWVALKVIGSPADLHTFRVVAVFDVDEYVTLEVLQLRVGTAGLMASRIIGGHQDTFALWLKDHLGKWFDNPAEPLFTHTTLETRSVDLFVEFDGEDFTFLLTVTTAE